MNLEQGPVRLKWTNHNGTLVSVLKELLTTQSMVDCTLACEGQYLQAHKIVLSGCSPFFKDIFSLDSSKHPIVFLRNVKFSEVKALVEYIYSGVVDVSPDELNSLLLIAQELKIRGLADIEPRDNSSSTSPEEPQIFPESTQTPPKNPETLSLSNSIHPNLELGADFSSNDGDSFYGSSTKRLRLRSSTHANNQNQLLPQTKNQNQLLPQTKNRRRFRPRRKLSKSFQKHSATPSSTTNKRITPAPARPVTDSPFVAKVPSSSEENIIHDNIFEPKVIINSDSDAEHGEISLSQSSASNQKNEEHEEEYSLPDLDIDDDDGKTKFNLENETCGIPIRPNADGLYVCQNCGKVYQKEHGFSMHIRYDCPSLEPKFICDLCDFKAKRKARLQIHKEKTHGLKI